MTSLRRSFDLNYGKLKEISLKSYRAYLSGLGIFKNRESFLPQWALPSDFEYSPQREEVKNPEVAGNYLFVMASLERRMQSRQNIKNGKKAWVNPKASWIFNPHEVVKRDLSEIETLFTNEFKYKMPNFASGFLANNYRIVRDYDGLALNVINGQTIEEAKRRTIKFKGIKTGIANLFILYLTDRMIASVQNPLDRQIKIDVHKSRVPVNNEAIIAHGPVLRKDVLVTPLEKAYHQICVEEGLNAGRLDSALWIIGSEICVKKDRNICAALCPLEQLCGGCVGQNKAESEFFVYEDNGKTGDEDKRGLRIDTRRRKEQGQLDIGPYAVLEQKLD